MIRTVAVIGTLAVAATVSFQRALPAIALKPADAFLTEPFGSIRSVRELSDGRVLISDASSENRLVVADLRAGSVRLVGRNGAGPGEYRQAGALFPLAGDSTLFIDSPARGRWWLLLSRDSIVRNLPPDLPALRIVGGAPVGADTMGRILGVRSAGATRLSSNINRSSLVAVLGSLDGDRADTVARLRGSDAHITQTGTRERPFWIEQQLVGSAPEQALLFPDGWIAVVRLEPYRVEWRSSDGRWIRGSEIAWEAPRADAREKAAAFAVQKRRNPDAKQVDMHWAERLDPIRPRAVGTPEGNLLVLRAQWSRAMDTNYDVFDRTGSRIATLQMPDSERVFGFGRRSVYVTVQDSDGIVRIRRHPWP